MKKFLGIFLQADVIYKKSNVFLKRKFLRESPQKRNLSHHRIKKTGTKKICTDSTIIKN